MVEAPRGFWFPALSAIRRAAQRRGVLQVAGPELGAEAVREVAPGAGGGAGDADLTAGVTRQRFGDSSAEHAVAAQDRHRLHGARLKFEKGSSTGRGLEPQALFSGRGLGRAAV